MRPWPISPPAPVINTTGFRITAPLKCSPQRCLHLGDRNLDLAEVVEDALDLVQRGRQRLRRRHAAAFDFPCEVARRFGARPADLERTLVRLDQPANFLLLLRGHRGWAFFQAS